MVDQADEPRDQAPYEIADLVGPTQVPQRSGGRVRMILIAAGAAVVVAGAVIAVTLTASHTAPASSASPVAAASSDPASSDSPDSIVVGADPGCAPAEGTMMTLLDSLTTDVTDQAKATADVQTAAAVISQASAAARSPAVKQALGKTSTDLAALRAATATSDLQKVSSAVGPLASDVSAIYTACGA